MLLLFKQLIKKWVPQYSFLQRFYLGIYYMGLWGMNYGRTPDLKGSGELKALNSVKALFPPNPVLIDVGANIGDYSLLLNEHFEDARIHAFEPVKSTFDLLKQNIVHSKNIVAHHLGLGDQNHEMEIFSSIINAHSSMVDRSAIINEEVIAEKIQVRRLSDFAAEHNIEQIDFLKVDVEGFEINVLRGAKELLCSRKIKCIQFEFGGTMIDAHCFLRDFYEILGREYNLFRITKSGLFPIGDYQPHHEIFHYCNYMAILKANLC